MPAPFTPQELQDYLFAFDAGVNGGISPLLLPRNTLADGRNLTVRGTFARPRPPHRKLTLTWVGGSTQAKVEHGFFQGGAYYIPDSGIAVLLAAIGGELFRFTPDAVGGCVVDQIPAPTTGAFPGIPNPPGQPQAWMWQAEKWLIWQDGISPTLFFDGTSMRRSNGPSQLLGEIAAPGFIPPLVNTPVDITLVAPYNGPINVPILIGNAIYKVTSVGGAVPQQGYAIVVKNMTDTPGNTVPAGDPVVYDSAFVAVVANAFTLLGNSNRSSPTHFETFNTLFSWVPSGAFGPNVFVDGRLSTVFSLPTPTSLTVFSNSATTFNIPAGALVKNTTGTVLSLGSVVQDVTLFPPPATGGFIVPAIGANVTVYLSQQYAGPVNRYISISGKYYLIVSISAPTSPAPGTVIRAINLIDTPDTVNRHYYPLALTPYGDQVVTMPEMLPGRMGAYGMGRNWYSLPDGISFRATDLVGESSGTVAENFRDAVLKEAENLYLNTAGNFRIPGQTGSIRAMRFIAIMDRALGQGPLQVATPKAIFSCNAPVDRAAWQTLANPILTETLKPKGALGQNSTINSNSDLIFRAPDGIRSEILGVRQFALWGNVPLSREVAETLDADDQSLLNFSSAIEFDNRMLMTAHPVSAACGTVHSKLVALNYDPVSSLRGKKESVWDGVWDGLQILQLLVGEFALVERAFAFTFTDGVMTLHELLPSSSTQVFDNATERIRWIGTSGVIDFGETDPKIRPLKRLLDGEIFVDQMVGLVHFEVYYKPDQWPTWQLWHSWDRQGGPDIANPKFQPRMGLGEPNPDPFDPDTDRPLREGYVYQVMFVINGQCRFLGARFRCVTMPQPQFALPAPLSDVQIIGNPPILPPAVVGSLYTLFLYGSWTIPPITWELVSGTLPPGLVFDPVTGEISGTPTVGGDFTFTIHATDGTGPPHQSSSQTFTISVGILITNTSPLASGSVGVAYNVAMLTSGATAPLAWSVLSGALPAGLTLDPVTGIISGTPTVIGLSSFVIGVTDSSP